MGIRSTSILTADRPASTNHRRVLQDALKARVGRTLSESALAAVLEKLATTDLPNLWKPKKDQFIHVPAIPILGTGKTDLRKVRELAATSGGQL